MAEHIENQDPTISLRALDLSFKVDGSAKERQEQQTPTIALVDLSQFRMHYPAEKTIDVVPEEE